MAFRDRFLLVFAGGSMAACFADLHALDTHTMVWSQPPVVGATPSPRAGAAACAWSGLLSGCSCEQQAALPVGMQRHAYGCCAWQPNLAIAGCVISKLA